MDGYPPLLDVVSFRERNNRCFEETKRTMPELKHFFFRTLLNWISILCSHSLCLIIDLID